MEVDRHYFHVVDYVVFVLMLCVSMGIGVYFAIVGRHHNTTEDYLMGNRNMKLLPVSMSLVVSVVSANTLLGAPADTYYYGIMYFFMLIGLIPATIIVCIWFVPLFYPMRITSANEVMYICL